MSLSKVVVCIDGWFYTHDITLWVQWYFLGTWHYPFIKRRPDEFDLENHPYRLVWHSVSIEDLKIEERVSCRMTLLRRNLLEKFRDMARELSDKILKAKTLAPEEPEKYRDMEHSRRGMLAAIAILDCAPQSEHATLMTVASFQRHFLESLACYEYLTVWRLRESDAMTDIHPVDTSIMGMINLYSGAHPEATSPSSHPSVQQVPPRRMEPAKAVNCTKFFPPDSPFSPQLLPAWKNALKSLATHYSRIEAIDHPNRDLLCGYYVPDPFLFLKKGSELTNAMRYLVAWDFMCTDWMSRILGLNQSENGVKIPQPQHWHGMLFQVAKARGLCVPVNASSAMHLVPSSSTSSLTSSAASSHKRKLSGLAAEPSSGSSSVVDSKKRKTGFDKELATLLENVDITEGPPDSFYVSGTLVLLSEDLVKAKGHVQIHPCHGQQMVWELFENNFRLELLALDRCVRPRVGIDADAAAVLDSEVVEVFPQGSWVVTWIPAMHEGLGALEVMDRVVYLERFRILLSSWPSQEAAALKSLSVFRNNGLTYRLSAVNTVEAAVVPFYC